MSDKVITRLQKFLRVLVDESAYMPEPLKILEHACCYACGHLDSMPHPPVTRREKLIASVRDKSIVPPTPVTRLEKYIAAIAGYYTDDLPEPVTREDKILYDLACGEDVTLSGNPLVLENSIGKPLKECVISWEPTQAGSGEPYPAGGGKNLLNPAGFEANKTINGITFAHDGKGNIKVSGTSTARAIFILDADFEYTFSITTNVPSAVVGEYVISANGLQTGITLTRPTDARRMYIRVGGNYAVNTTVRVQLEKGSTATAYAPYENIRPISGRDAVKVERCGVNLLDILKYAPNGYNLAGKNILKPNTTYTFSPMKSGNIAFAVFLTDSIEPTESKRQMNLTGIYCNEGTSVTFTTPNETSEFPYIWIAGAKDGIHLVWPDVKFMLAVATTAPAAYTPYRGDTLALALPSTIYGGTVDAVTGAGEQKWGLATFDGSEAWTIGGLAADKRDWYYASPKIVDAINGPPKSGEEICSHYPHYDVANNNTGKGCALVWGGFRVRWGDIIPENTDAWKSYLAAQYAAGTPVQIAYKLAEPVPFQATGAAGEITTFKGTNTLMTDADEITATYKCNVKAAEKAVNEIYEQCLQEVEDIQNDSKTLQTSG